MTDSRVKVARNSLWLIAQPVIISVVSVMVTALVARHLGAADYGLLLLLVSWFALFSMVASLGLRQHMVREIAGGGAVMDVLEENLWLRLILSGASALLLLGANFTFSIVPPASHHLVALIALQVVVHGVAVCFIDALYGLEEMRAAAAIQALAGLSVQGLLLAAVWLQMSLTILVSVYVAGSGLLLVAGLRGISRKAGWPRLHWRRRLRVSQAMRGWQMFLPSLFESLRQRVAFFFLGGLLGHQSVGVFGAAQTLVQKLDVIPDGVATASFSRTARLAEQARAELLELVQGTLKVLLVLGMPVACGLPFVANEIVAALYGDAYRDTARVLMILGVGLPFLFAQILLFYVLAGMREHNRLMYVSAVGTAVGVAMFWAGVHMGGIDGAALAYVLTLALLAGGYFCVFWMCLGLPIRLMDLAKVGLANAIMALVLWLMAPLAAVWTILVGALVYVGAVFGLRLVRWGEIQAVFARRSVGEA